MQSIGISRILAGAAVALAAIAGVAAGAGAGCGGELSQQADPPDRPVRGRRRQRHLRAAGRRQGVGEFLGQQLVIENRPAAGGRPAAEFVANQPADGYTLFVGASGVMSIASAVYPKLAYHPTKSFIPLSMIANFPLILVSPVENPAKTVRGARRLCQGQSRQGELRHHVAGVHDLDRAPQAQDRHARRRDPAQEQRRDDPVRDAAAVPALDLRRPARDPADQGRQGARAGGDRCASARRSFRTCRAWRKSGLPEVNTKLWSGFFVPAKTPPAIAAKLEAALRKAITDPGVSSKLQRNGGEPRRHRLGRLPQDDRRRHPELRRGGEGGESEVRIAAP